MKRRTIPLPYLTITIKTTTNTFFPATGWMSASDITRLRQTWELVYATGAAQATLGYQVADTEDNPGAFYLLGSLSSTTGMKFPTGGWTNAGVTLGAKQLVRFGYVASLTTGTTLGSLHLGGRVDTSED